LCVMIGCEMCVWCVCVVICVECVCVVWCVYVCVCALRGPDLTLSDS